MPSYGSLHSPSLRKMENSGVQAEPCSYVRIGDRVKVKEGPLSGITGILAQIKNRRQLVISIDAIMRSVSVDIGSIEVHRFDHSAAEQINCASLAADI